MADVVDINTNTRELDYDYHSYHIHITFRPRYRDFRWTIIRTIELKHSENAPTMPAAKRAAEKYIDTIRQKKGKTK